MSVLVNWFIWLVAKLTTRSNIIMSNDKELVTKLLTTIGSLELYSVQTISEYNADLPPNTFYYTDNRYLTEWQGPFHSIYNATQHYTSHIETFKKAVKVSTGKDYVEQNPKSNIIMVNFVTKQYHRPSNT